MAGLALAVRFALELIALAALGYGGWRLDGPVGLRLVMAVALPVAAAASTSIATPVRLD